LKWGTPKPPRGPSGGGSGAPAAGVVETATDTPEFKRWFGDSKVVDKAGEPLVVYHGTKADFEAFDVRTGGTQTLGQGSYFTVDPREASSFAGERGSVIPAYLAIRNPFIRGKSTPGAAGEQVVRDYLESRGFDGDYIKGKMSSFARGDTLEEVVPPIDGIAACCNFEVSVEKG
jgi:hypothetical protein